MDGWMVMSMDGCLVGWMVGWMELLSSAWSDSHRSRYRDDKSNGGQVVESWAQGNVKQKTEIARDEMKIFDFAPVCGTAIALKCT